MELPAEGPTSYCRFCLGKDDLRGLFGDDKTANSRSAVDVDALVEKIYECTNIKLCPSADDPCAICRQCLQAVEEFYHFRTRSKQVNDLIKVTAVVTASNETKSTAKRQSQAALGMRRSTVPNEKMSKVNTKLLHRCRYCPKSFRGQDALTEHCKRAHVANRQHHCPNCMAQFQHAPSLARHVRNRSCYGFNKYRCRVCSESFTDRLSWAEHIQVHAKDFPHQCPDCWSQFKHKATLRRHANTVHLLVKS
ncbi:zinc finger protein 287-like [Anopheles bellator]|uniref:zinc finger protein 287-like n=1 Tax=Anopheles bellator TaxID=139047 RepID=UPI0026491363|nr:zinc finger protein 287-like [Anopheles bellator]